jgi:glycerol transport system permease protein
MKPRRVWKNVFLVIYFIFLALPLLWMLSMSFKTNAEILSTRSLIPQQLTVGNYQEIFTEPFWRESFINSLSYVLINTTITLIVSIPAAYAFSRFNFTGDNACSSGQIVWLPAVFLLPYFQHTCYCCLTHRTSHHAYLSSISPSGLEGFMSGV